MIRAITIAAALALSACAQPRAMRLGPPSSDIPPALHHVVQVMVESDEGTGRGWATPVRPGRLLTIAHMIARRGQWTDDAGHGGALGYSWEDKRLAEFTISGDTQPALVTIADALPGVMETVWWRYYIEPGDRPALAQGRVLGIDSDGDMHIDGMGAEGSSGSAILNARGQLVGVMLGGWNQAAPPSSDEVSTADAFRLLFRRVAFRPVAVAVPVAGAMPGPGSTR